MTSPAVIRSLTYILGGIVYSSAGYFKNVKENPSTRFDPVNFTETVLIGAVAGFIALYMGDDFSDASLAAAMGIAIPIVDKAVNMARNRTSL